jgi:hypothetical protein
MRVEEFYKKLRELLNQYPDVLIKALEIRFHVNAVVGMGSVLLRHPRHTWIKNIAMACLLNDIIDPLLLRHDKIPDYMFSSKAFIEALNNLSQEDFDIEFDKIVEVIRDLLKFV